MFEFDSSEQKEIRSSVRKLAEREIPRFQGEEFYNSTPRDLFQQFAGLGLTGLSIPEEFGGADASPTTCSLISEEIARVDLGPAIFLSVHLMVCGLIAKFGTAAQKQHYLPGLAKGDLLGAYALSEQGAGSDAASLTCRAEKTQGGFVLNGEKAWITSAGFADVYLVFARTTPEGGKNGISAFLVPCDAAGVSFGKPERKMGCELSPIASVHLSDVKLAAESVLGEINQGYKIALSGLAGGRISIASCANGISRASLDASILHLKDRKQFGQALVSFQGLQFMLADMKMALEASLVLTYRAARLLEQDRESRENRIHPSIAKCFATDTAMRLSTDAVQLLGASGYVKESKVEKLMRDAKMLQIVEGTNQIQRMLIAREVAAL